MARTKKEKLSLDELLEQSLVKPEDQPYQVPSNWVWTNLKELVILSSGYAFDSKKFTAQKELGFPLIRIRDIVRGYTQTYTSEEYDENYLIYKGDILIGMDGDFNIARWNSGPALLNQRVCKLRAKTNACLEKYIYYFLPEQLYIINSMTSSVTVKHLSLKTLEKVKVPLPPLAEQKRIVEMIESLLRKLDTAKELVQNALDSFEKRKAVILHKAFTGELTSKWREENGVSLDSWEERTMEECGKWYGGGTPAKSQIKYWTNGDILWVTPKDMKTNVIVDSEDKITREAVEKSSAKLIDEPAVLFVMRSGILRRILPIAITTGTVTVNQDMKAVIPKDINIEYLFWYCVSKERDIREKCSKSGTTVESINSKALYEYKVNIPSKSEQQQIVNIINQLLSKEEKAAELLEVVEKIELMKKSILARAFRGGLGTNNLEEESAENLLREILEKKLL